MSLGRFRPEAVIRSIPRPVPTPDRYVVGASTPPVRFMGIKDLARLAGNGWAEIVHVAHLAQRAAPRGQGTGFRPRPNGLRTRSSS